MNRKKPAAVAARPYTGSTTISFADGEGDLDEEDFVSPISPNKKVPLPQQAKPILKPPGQQAKMPYQQNASRLPVPVGKQQQAAAKPLQQQQPPAKDYKQKKLEMQQQEDATRDFEIPAESRARKPTQNKVLWERFRTMRDRFQDVSDGLKCGICGNIFLDPVQIVHIDCNHVFCERCLEERTSHELACPECGFTFSQQLVKPAKNLSNIILDQSVPCFFEPAGCMQHIKFRDLEEHERRCNFNPERIVECLCGEEMPVSQHNDHLKTACPEFLLDCPHGCGEKVKRKELTRHEDFECVLKPVRCEFAKFGCTFKGPRADLYKHNKDQFQAHMGMMAGRIQDLEAESKKMHIQQRESQRQMEAANRRGITVEGGGFETSIDILMPDSEGHKQSLYTTGDSRLKIKKPSRDDVMFDGSIPGASDRIMPKGLTVMNEILRPKWTRTSQPKRIIEGPRDGSYKFVRPFACAFLTDYTIAMTDCKSAWLIDVETGGVRNSLEPVTTKKQLYRPRGVAVQQPGLRTYVADSQSDSVHMFSPGGEYINSFGRDYLKYPLGLATYYNRVYVCDSHHNTLQIFDATGSHVGSLAEEYHGSPTMACASEGTGLVYVTMNSTSDSYVLVVDHLGEFVTTFGVKGDEIGLLNKAGGITVDQHDNVFVANANQFKVQMFGKISTKSTLRERRRWENKVREQIWLEEMKKKEPQWDDDDNKQPPNGEDAAAAGAVDVGGEKKSFEDRVQERLKSRPTEMDLPLFEYRPVDWLGSDEMCSPGGLAISPNKTILAVVDEVKNKLYIY